MKKVGSDKLTYHEFMYTLVGSMIGTGILSLPNSMAKIAKQDGWIAAFIAVWYPLYIIIMAIYFCRKYPEDNILTISKKCFGKLIGSLLALVFTIQFLVDLVSVAAGYSNVARVYIIEFLDPMKLIGIILLVGIYGTFQGLKVIGRVNELTFYLLIALLFIPLIALRDGTFLNVSPVLGAGFKSILSGSRQAIFAYTGIEIILLIYPYMIDKKHIKSAALKAVGIIAAIYTYVTFITIFYIGPDVILKEFWSVMVINETINLPFINSFRFIFMFLWSLIILKTIVNLYFSLSFGLSNSVIKFRIQKLCFFIYPVILYIAIKYGNEVSRRNIISKASPLITYYNLIYITLLAVIIYFKKGKKNEST